MFRTKLHCHLTAWIAICAILLGALAPTVTNALAWLAHGDAQAVARTTAHHASGHMAHTRDVAHHADAAPPSAEDHHGGAGHEGGHGNAGTGHCPFCGTHAGSFGLPPAELPASVQPAGLHVFLPHLYRHAPRPLFAWATAHPRAPPVRS